MESKAKTEKSAVSRIRQRQRLKKDLSAWILLLPVVAVLYLMIWRPTVMGGIWSFYEMKGYTPKEFAGLENYYEVIKDTQFVPTLLNTIKYVLWSLVIGYIPPVIIAVFINEMVHFKNGFKITMYLPAIIPGIAASLMWYYMYFPDESGLLNMVLMKFGMEPYGWLNDERFTILYIIISMTWQSFAGTVILYFAALQGVSTELYEAATIDGAGMFKRFWNITVPQISGLLLLNLISQIKSVFQVMEQPMAMTGGGPNNASISVGFQLYKYGFVSGRAGHAMALGVIIFLILIVITCFYFYLQKKVEENY